MSKILFLDIETTGFSRDWNEIIELGAILWDDNKQDCIDSFHEYIKPLQGLPAKITELTGITREKVSGCRNERLVLMDFVEWVAIVKPDIIVGHNCKTFDLGFIAKRCEKFSINWNIDGIQIIDTLALAKQMNKTGEIKTENNKQQTLAAYFGITYNAHSAIEDVKALIQIYNKMTNIQKDDVGF